MSREDVEMVKAARGFAEWRWRAARHCRIARTARACAALRLALGLPAPAGVPREVPNWA